MCMNQAELPFESVGHFQLKGITGDIPTYRAVGRTRCWLPPASVQAVKSRTLVHIRKGEPLPPLPPDPILVFEGFRPSSKELGQVIDSLPVLDPARLWLSTYHVAPQDRYEWLQSGHGMVVGTPEALTRALAEVRLVESRPSSSNTIILDLGAASEVELVMAGLALPAVPMAEVVASYTYDLLPDGRWVNRSDQAVARVDIGASAVRLTPTISGISIDGRAVPPSQTVILRHGNKITTPGGAVTFFAIGQGPYAGLLVADTAVRMGVARAREGGFTLDRALAGRRQAAVEVGPQGTCTLRALHERCPTYIYSDGSPLRRVDPVAPVQLNEFVVTGTTVVALRPPS
jgi:hypothetical protein